MCAPFFFNYWPTPEKQPLNFPQAICPKFVCHLNQLWCKLVQKCYGVIQGLLFRCWPIIAKKWGTHTQQLSIIDQHPKCKSWIFLNGFVVYFQGRSTCMQMPHFWHVLPPVRLWPCKMALVGVQSDQPHPSTPPMGTRAMHWVKLCCFAMCCSGSANLILNPP